MSQIVYDKTPGFCIYTMCLNTFIFARKYISDDPKAYISVPGRGGGGTRVHSGRDVWTQIRKK